MFSESIVCVACSCRFVSHKYQIEMNAAVHGRRISSELVDVVELNNVKMSADSNSASNSEELRLPSSEPTVPLSNQLYFESDSTVDVKAECTETTASYENESLDVRDNSDGPLCDETQDSDSISNHHILPFASLTREECCYLESLFHSVDSLTVSNSELQQCVSTLTTKICALEKSFEESKCLNRTMERNLDLIQSENDTMKKRLQQVVSDVSAADRSLAPSAMASDTAVKPVDVTTLLSNDLESTKTQVQTLGNDVISISALTKDINDKVIWLESEFQKFYRKHSLIVENLCPKEDKSASAMFLVFANSVLNVKVEDGEIDSVHVLNVPSATGVSPEKRPRPILVTFSCYGIRSRIFNAWLAYRSSQMQGPGALSGERGSGICIKEYLTNIQDSIYNEALQVRDRHQIADCWTFKGKTYVRTLEGDVREFNQDQWPTKNSSTAAGCSVM